MADYAAINVRIKVKKDIPAAIQTFIDTIFVEADINKAMAGLRATGLDNEVRKVINMSALQTLYQTRHNELDCLDSMLNMKSAYHNSWCWRVKEDRGDHWLYESRASCTHRSTNEDVLQVIMVVLAPYLVVSKEDIVARILYEDFHLEQVLVLAGHPLIAVWSDGYRYKAEDGYVCDSNYPGTVSRGYPYVLSDAVGADSRTRLVSETAEFVPPWSKTTVDSINEVNRTNWNNERNERGWLC